MHREATGGIRVAVAALIAATALAAGVAQAAGGAAQQSSCIACHTDVAKLQVEAKGIPVPAGSVLQAGKG